MKTMLLSVMAVSVAACSTIKPYEKEYLLSPVMDDATTATLESRYLPSIHAKMERLSATGAGAVGTACPTCGG